MALYGIGFGHLRAAVPPDSMAILGQLPIGLM